MNYSFIPPAITSSIIAIFLLTGIKRYTSSKQYRALFLLGLNTIWWHGSWVFLFLTSSISRASFIAKFGHVGILGLPFTVHYFYTTLVGRESDLFLTKICTYLFFLVCLLSTNWVVNGVDTFPWGYYPKAGILHPLFLFVVSFFIIRGLLFCYFEIKKTTDTAKKRVLQICQTAGVIYSLAAVDFLVNYSLTDTYPFGFAFSIIFILLLAYAVLSSDLFSNEAKLLEARKSLEESRIFNEKLTEALKVKEKELIVVQADLIQSEKLAALGTLAAGIAHEINNAVYGASACLSSLKKVLSQFDFESEKKSKIDTYLSSMKDGLDLTTNIVQSLRDYTGLNKAKFNEIVLEDIVSSVILLMKSSIPERVEIVLNLQSDLKFYGNAASFHQIFMNFITNSIDAIPEVGTITISAKSENGFIEIVFSDTGSGIPENVRGKIFDPFFTTKPVGKGSGLGLYIIHGEIIKHKGTIAVESELGKGTTFRIRMPADLQPDSL